MFGFYILVHSVDFGIVAPSDRFPIMDNHAVTHKNFGNNNLT